SLTVASEKIPKDICFNMWDEAKFIKEPSYLNLAGKRAIQISVTTFVNQHNYTLVSEIRNFGVKYRILSKEALDEINIMMRHSNLLLIVQKSLLKARFLDLNFQDQDLANAIQK
ncbi:9535_t:CDS:2, partial [Racocetra persica]